MSSDTSLPLGLEDRLRTYFGAFLPDAAVDEALDEVVSDLHYWRDADEVSAFRTAHLSLTSQVRVATDVEALVLHHDAHLPVSAVARILGMPEADVGRLLDAALAELREAPSASAPQPIHSGNTIRIDAVDEPFGEESHGPSTSTDDRSGVPRRGLLAGLVGALLIAAVLIVLAAGDAWGCVDAAETVAAP